MPRLALRSACATILLWPFAALARDHSKPDRIPRFPGQPHDLELSMYGGHITVDRDAGRHLYYTLVEAEYGLANAAPLVLWLNGGPGCSSLGGGLMSELGPFYPHKDGRSLKSNPYRWTQAANMLFLESPAFVGFSYSETEADAKTGDARTAEDAVRFLLRFYHRFPRYAQRPLYLAGESYSGHYVPTLAHAILRYNARPEAGKYGVVAIQLKGFMVGNAWTDAATDNRGAADFWFSHALIPATTHQGIVDACDFSKVGPLRVAARELQAQAEGGAADVAQARECERSVGDAMAAFSGINIYDIYADVCVPARAVAGGQALLRALGRRGEGRELTHHSHHSKSSGDGERYDPCIDDEVYRYLNQQRVQAAMHANATGAVPGPWEDCSPRVQYSRDDLLASMLPVYRELLKSDLYMLVYSGDVDAIVPVTGTRRWIAALGLKETKPWRAWRAGEQVGGFRHDFDGLHFATVRGAGHMVPYTQPQRALKLFQAFLADAAAHGGAEAER